MRSFFKSATMGVLALILVNFSSFISGVSLSINIFSLCISSILGIPGVITMLIFGYILI